MISQKLKTLFGFSVPLFVAHGLEEYFTGIYTVDSHVRFVFSFTEHMMPLQASFLLFQAMFWCTLIVSYTLISGGRLALWTLAIPGFVFLYELHHFYSAFEAGGYYPGLITALVFPVLGYFYWKEWLKVGGIRI